MHCLSFILSGLLILPSCSGQIGTSQIPTFTAEPYHLELGNGAAGGGGIVARAETASGTITQEDPQTTTVNNKVARQLSAISQVPTFTKLPYHLELGNGAAGGGGIVARAESASVTSVQQDPQSTTINSIVARQVNGATSQLPTFTAIPYHLELGNGAAGGGGIVARAESAGVTSVPQDPQATTDVNSIVARQLNATGASVSTATATDTQATGPAVNDPDLDALLADPDAILQPVVEAGGTLDSFPFDLLQPVGNAAAQDVGTEKLRKRVSTTMQIKNGTIQGKHGYPLIPSPMDRTKALTFLNEAKSHADSQPATDDSDTYSYTNGDYSLVMFVYEKIPGMRPGWYIFYDVASNMIKTINHYPDEKETYKGYISQGDGDASSAAIDFAMVISFGDVKAPASSDGGATPAPGAAVPGAGPKRDLSRFNIRGLSKEAPSPNKDLALSPRDPSSPTAIGSVLGKREEPRWIKLPDNCWMQIKATNVQVARGLMSILASELYSQLERDVISAKVYYRQAIAQFRDPTTQFTNLVAAAGHTPTIQILAAAGQQLDWGFLLNIAGGLQARAARSNWGINAGSTPSVGGFIVRGAASVTTGTIIGAWSWGIDVHAWLALVGEAAWQNVACTFTIAGDTAVSAQSCFNRIEL